MDLPFLGLDRSHQCENLEGTVGKKQICSLYKKLCDPLSACPFHSLAEGIKHHQIATQVPQQQTFDNVDNHVVIATIN